MKCKYFENKQLELDHHYDDIIKTNVSNIKRYNYENEHKNTENAELHHKTSI